MISQADSARPPHVAAWLITLFSPSEKAEWVLGDLLEEYSHLYSQSGVAFARSWYWRQHLRQSQILRRKDTALRHGLLSPQYSAAGY